MKKEFDVEELAEIALTAAVELNKELDNTMTTDQEYWYQEGYRDGFLKAMEDKV